MRCLKVEEGRFLVHSTERTFGRLLAFHFGSFVTFRTADVIATERALRLQL